ncbi:ABC transporter permease subunit, partial [Profundibacter sp.]
MTRALPLHLGLIALLFALQFALPAYHHGNLARIMVMATFAMGYNIMFGYTGLLSLGHAMFFAAGMYGMGLAVTQLGMPVGPAFLMGIAAAFALSLIVGLLALRTIGVAFMIVTLMFSQTLFLTIL